MEPITKAQVQEKLDERVFPDFIIQAFNECITEAKIKKRDTVYQKDVLKRIKELSGKGSTEVFANNWLDVEKYYEKAGWKVAYHKPAYNESGDSYFIFS